MIKFTCLNCGEKMEAPDSLRGEFLDCPKCDSREIVPDKKEITVVSVKRREANIIPKQKFQIIKSKLSGIYISKKSLAIILIAVVVFLYFAFTSQKSSNPPKNPAPSPRQKHYTSDLDNYFPPAPPAPKPIVKLKPQPKVVPVVKPPPEPPPQKPVVYNPYQVVSIGYMSYNLLHYEWKDSIKDIFGIKRPNAKFFVVELIVRNDDKKERSVPSFKLIDENGAEYGTTSSLSLKDSLGIFDSLNPGVQQRGRIVFDAPPHHTYLLKVSGGFWSSEDALIRLTP